MLIEAKTDPSLPPSDLPTELNEGRGGCGQDKCGQLAYYLQKPALEELQGYNGGSDTAVVDTGVVIFTGTACQVSLLIALSCDEVIWLISLYTLLYSY